MPLDTSIPLQVQIPQFAEPIDPATRQYNALRQQALQQEMMRNQLIMQNTMEDRRLAAAQRAQAAQKAAEERANAAYLTGAIRSGYTPAKEAVMGPGTVQGSTPASFDQSRVLNALYAKGNPSLLTAYSNMQEQIAKQQEAEAKVPGTAAESRKKGAEADKAEFANAFDQMSVLAPYIASGAMPARAAVDVLLKHPVAGKLLSSAMTPEQMLDFADKNPQSVAQILATPPDKIYESLAAPQKYSVQDTAQGIMRVPETGTGPAIPLTGPSGETLMPVDRRSVTNIDMKGEGAFAGELGKLEAADVIKNRGVAEDARSVIDTINTGRTLLDKGVFSGFGANFKLNFAKAAKELGASGFDGKVENTEAYASNMAQNVGKLIKQFGAGTGLSDADRKYAEQMAGGQISLDEKSMRKILEISDRAARNVILAHNKRVEGIPSKTGLTVELPPAAPVSTGGVSVTTPSGKVFSFPTPEAAAQFKKAAGIP